ncbi:redox-sensing transcriptional repressor Rex [Aerococcus urinaehominis]|uniref:Redox-sensing transcriptional repressor Rex n=1 Tax=Aerococcus urinaehominis TaxID=128944 RepID=A0A109RGU9_9LACT|nr:redox-sensing transcriptional repressor Rex [Aerococcus urinaehominis]AMB99399.1 redox-sensing transcriptional repressor Rex [Aerococcus urinaehominis]SDM23868.1 redox-sensing transcriptional repressor [Aerococcus urinaehominis]
MIDIPKATAKRLPLYHRYLQFFKNMGKDRISSNELSEAVKVDSATIRRDFSYFGALGKRGYGYDIAYLLDFFGKTLSQDKLTTIILVGAGNLGNALINYNFRQSNNTHIGAAFDVDESLVGEERNGVQIYPLSQMSDYIKDNQVDIAILTVPSDHAQNVADDLVAAGIAGILNFTPVRLDIPSHVRVQNVDLTNELQTLIYFISKEN